MTDEDDIHDRLQRGERAAHAVVRAEGSAWLPRSVWGAGAVRDRHRRPR